MSLNGHFSSAVVALSMDTLMKSHKLCLGFPQQPSPLALMASLPEADGAAMPPKGIDFLSCGQGTRMVHPMAKGFKKENTEPMLCEICDIRLWWTRRPWSCSSCSGLACTRETPVPSQMSDSQTSQHRHPSAVTHLLPG